MLNEAGRQQHQAGQQGGSRRGRGHHNWEPETQQCPSEGVQHASYAQRAMLVQGVGQQGGVGGGGGWVICCT